MCKEGKQESFDASDVQGGLCRACSDDVAGINARHDALVLYAAMDEQRRDDALADDLAADGY